MFLKPDGKIDLEHRAYLLQGTPLRSVLIAAALDGTFSVVGPGLKEVQVRRFPSKVRAMSLHPSNGRLAWVDGKVGSLIVQDLNGSRPLKIAPPQVQESTPAWVQRGFDYCTFGQDGASLWTVAPSNAKDVVVRLHDFETGRTIDQATIKDPFGGSSCSFHPTGKPSLLCLWLAAGNPDMVQVYWLERTQQGFSWTLETHLGNTLPPVFSPSGDHFLVLNDENAICKFDFATMRQHASPLVSEDEDNPFSESLCFLNDQQALAGTNEGRIFLVDTARVKVVEEVSLEGHEPRPIGEYYPMLAKESGLATDISWFTRLGEVILFVYRRDRGTGLVGWKDSLLWLSVNEYR